MDVYLIMLLTEIVPCYTYTQFVFRFTWNSAYALLTSIGFQLQIIRGGRKILKHGRIPFSEMKGSLSGTSSLCSMSFTFWLPVVQFG